MNLRPSGYEHDEEDDDEQLMPDGYSVVGFPETLEEIQYEFNEAKLLVLFTDATDEMEKKCRSRLLSMTDVSIAWNKYSRTFRTPLVLP